jgi:hypothetical protein
MPAKLGQQPPPAWCEQEHRTSASQAGRIDHLPPVDQAVVDQAVIGEKLQPHLGGADPVEEELLDLEGVQVAVVVESLEDGEVALGQRAEEAGGFFLGEQGAGVCAEIAKNDGMTMYGSPSRG